MDSPIHLYLDHAATTEIDKDVAATMMEMYSRPLGNPSSLHRAGRAAYQVIEQAKMQLLRAVDANCEDMHAATVIATSGGTEANNLAISGLRQTADSPIFISAIEHPSIAESAKRLAGNLCPMRIVPVDHNGLCRLDLLHQWLSEYRCSKADSGTPLVSVILGNNEVGVVQELENICELCHQFGALVHADCCQALGKIPFSMRKMQLDALSITAHKLHGPVGVGALIVRAGITVNPIIFGGGQQLGIRPGTETSVLMVGFARAVELSMVRLEQGVYRKLAELRDYFEKRVLDSISESMVLAKTVCRLPHVSNIAFRGLDRQALLMALDLAGIMCSTGSACASGSNRPSPIVAAMNVPPDYANGSMRFSFCHQTTTDDVDWAVKKLAVIVNKIRKPNCSI